MSLVHHALVLNLHQPAGNLEHLLAEEPWEAEQILFAIDRIPRSLWQYADLGRVHLSLSGTLLETLASPEFQSRVYGKVRVGDVLWYLQNKEIVEILGTGYYHPVLPLIPERDWPAQLERWLGIGQHLFWRTDFQGFWPPEMAFAQELIPALRRAGYRYVFVDSEHVEAVDPMSWHELRYRPHVAEYQGSSIIVIVRDRELSDAQESGMDVDWFAREIADRTKFADYPPLVTTCTDGDNGGWFRNTSERSNFWNAFYTPLLDRCRASQSNIRPTFIHDYLARFGAHGRVKVRTGAWNTGWHHGRDFLQWTGSDAQKQALRRVRDVSQRLHGALQRGKAAHELEGAYHRLLRAQTSCNFFWGEAWVDRAHADLDAATAELDRSGS
jgi:alpha-amylase/alpha-mannosidase (GH57 family)